MQRSEQIPIHCDRAMRQRYLHGGGIHPIYFLFIAFVGSTVKMSPECFTFVDGGPFFENLGLEFCGVCARLLV